MKKILICLAAAATLAGCSKVDDAPASDARRLSIVPLITRATETDFETGDRLGLTIVRTDGSNYCANAGLTYADGCFAGSVVWYDEGGEPSTLRAYYPFTAGSEMPVSFAVQSDQRGSGYALSDFISSVKQGVKPSSDAVTMTFRHRLTQLVVKAENNTGSELKSVKLAGLKLQAAIDPETLTVTAAEGATGSVTTFADTQNERWLAIVVPQQGAFELQVELADGTQLTQKTREVELSGGGSYTIEATVNPDGLKISVNGKIDGWEDKGGIEGEDSEPERDFEDHAGENYFLYRGERYTTVTLSNGQRWMAEPMRCLPAGFTPSADPTADAHIWFPYELGSELSNNVTAQDATALTDSESVKKFGYLYDACAALGGVEVTVDNCNSFEGAQGICPKGWHIPTRDEMLLLCGSSAWGPQDAPVNSPAQKIDKSALFYDETYNGGKIKSYNDAGWNYVLSGIRLQNGYTAAPTYQKVKICSGNTTSATPAEFMGAPALTYIMSSTCYKPIYKTGQPETPENLTNIQFFAQMTTFSSSTYPEGRVSLAYNSVCSGVQLRCICDAE